MREGGCSFQENIGFGVSMVKQRYTAQVYLPPFYEIKRKLFRLDYYICSMSIVYILEAQAFV